MQRRSFAPVCTSAWIAVWKLTVVGAFSCCVVELPKSLPVSSYSEERRIQQEQSIELNPTKLNVFPNFFS